MTYKVTLGDARATADDLHGALTVAAELLAQARRTWGDAYDCRALVITVDGELDEGATELAREGLRPARLGHGSKSHLGGPTQTP